VGTSYKRIQNIDKIIQSAKLPYDAWKILFLIDDQMDSKHAAGLLDEEESKVDEMFKRLETEGLIVAEPEDEAQKEIVVETAEPEVEEAIEQPEIVEEPESPPIEPELVEEEQAVEIGEEAVIEEIGIDENESIMEGIVEQEDSIDIEEEHEIKELSEDTEDFNFGDALKEEEKEENLEINILGEKEIVETETVEPLIDFDEDVKSDSEEIDVAVEEVKEEEEVESDLETLSFDEEVIEEKQEAEPQVETVDADEEAEEEKGGKIILVVDDSIVIRKMVEIALEEEDYNIKTAVNGKDALEMIDKVNTDLVILDLMLPDINGIDVLKTIKLSKGLPVIMLSGKDSPQMIEKAKAEGADAFLPKPFKDDELLEKIKTLIEA
jgi:CheY-like chemotaxis protein